LVFCCWNNRAPKQKDKNLDVSDEQADKYLDDYFFFKGLDFFHLRHEKLGYDTFSPEELIDFYLSLTVLYHCLKKERRDCLLIFINGNL